jgi:O-antigen ligase
LRLSALAAASFAFAPFMAEERELPRHVLLQLAGGITLAVCVAEGRLLAQRAWISFATIWVLCTALSTLAANSLGRSAFGPYEGHFGALAWFAMIALAASTPGLNALGRTMAVFACVGVTSALIGLVQAAVGADPTGSFGHVRFFGEFCTLSCLAVVGWALDVDSVRSRAWLLAAFTLPCVGIVISGRRGALVALMIGLVTLIGCRPRSLGKTLPFCTIILAVILLFGFTGSYTGGGMVQRMNAITTPSLVGPKHDTVGQRIDDYRVAVQAALERPWLGRGFGSFRDLYRERKLGPQMPEESSVHDVWLEILLATGFVGLLAFIGLLVSWVAAARTTLVATRGTQIENRVAACGAIGLAHLVLLTVGFDQPGVGAWAWALAGFLLVEPRPTPLPSTLSARWKRALAASALALLGLVGAQRVIADAAFAECLSMGILGRFSEVGRACDLALRLSPYECTYRLDLARLLRTRPSATHLRPLSLLDPCLSLEPENASVHHELGLALLVSGQDGPSMDRAISELTLAVRYSPHDPKPRRDLGRAQRESLSCLSDASTEQPSTPAVR